MSVVCVHHHAGGFGTLDQAFVVIMLIQTNKLECFPIVIMGDDFWEHSRDFIRRTMLDEGLSTYPISP